MIDILEEIEKLKAYVAGCADSKNMYPTYPPQHPWASGTTVEQMIAKLDSLKENIISDQEENQGYSAAARMLRNVADHSDISDEYYTRLLEIADMIDYEYANTKTHTEYIVPVDVMPNCKSLIVYIQSYVESGGPCTEHFIQGLYNYIDQIDTQMVNLSSDNAILRKENEILANRGHLLMRIHDLIDRS